MRNTRRATHKHRDRFGLRGEAFELNGMQGGQNKVHTQQQTEADKYQIDPGFLTGYRLETASAGVGRGLRHF